MKLCIAEKPSVARDIAKVLGATQMRSGYLEGNGYCVTWTFGHLCTLKEPHDYHPSYKYWDLGYLPIIPERFGLKLIPNKGVEQQFKVIEKLVASCEEVINCGDAGQEGELIQRWVLQKANCDKPVKRLWISSLTEEAIKEGFDNLKPAEEYKNLYLAGNARAIGDWLLGINATRLFTKKFGQNKAVLSIGRVQTPTLAMLVQRQKEINAFQSADYWELKTLYREVLFNAAIDRLSNKERAEKGLEYLQQHPFEIVAFEKKEGKEKNPRLFDLTGLQVEANKKFGFSAENTLKYVQSLYEKKHVTYPRVDTTYLSESLYPKIPGILQNLHYYQEFTAPLLQAPIPKSKAVFDDSKVTDHHAIIPTEICPPASLYREEKIIYDLIARRFIAVFYPDCKISNTLVEGKVGEIPFKATGKQILEPGWKIIYAKDAKTEEEEKNKEEEQNIPEFKVGESGPHEPLVHQGKTTAPKPYTEATILRAMETAGKQVEDEELRELMKSNGIGRPSTRANIIETLFKRKYIERKRKNIVATQTGMDLIDTIEDELLKSPELTGEWELKLRKIEKGEYEAQQFKQELVDMVVALTQKVIYSQHKVIALQEEKPATEAKPKKEKVPKDNTPLDWSSTDCPKCKQRKLMKGNTAVGCSDYQSCGFKVPFVVFGKKLNEKQLLALVQKGKTGKIKGFKEHPQNLEEGIISLDANWQLFLG
ncbi:MAG: DNA topoisomerase 3 [Taibaiella sp.]|nr:DNA topoisomerase 3 [Taibaiella sp.]